MTGTNSATLAEQAEAAALVAFHRALERVVNGPALAGKVYLSGRRPASAAATTRPDAPI